MGRVPYQPLLDCSSLGECLDKAEMATRLILESWPALASSPAMRRHEYLRS